MAAQRHLHGRLEAQRRAIVRREADLTARLGELPAEALRWTVRLLADCLPPAEQAHLLAGYDEYATPEALRAFAGDFLPRYTARALADLDARAGADPPGLPDLTDEELQGMSAAEKWHLLAANPDGLHGYRLPRELARLFMCHSFELFHDTGAGEAAVEFPTYFLVERRLQALPPMDLAALRDRVLARARDLDRADPAAVEAALEAARHAVARAAGFPEPPRPRPTDRMARIAFADLTRPATPAAPWLQEGLAGASPDALRLSLLVLVDLLSLAEARTALEPLRGRHPSLAAMPPEELRAALEGIAASMGDRQLTDFAERYRCGRTLALPHADPAAWRALPRAARLRALEADNAAMDAAQAARHLARILLTPDYEALFDPAAQLGLLRDPRYDRAVADLMGLGEGRLRDLNAAVTEGMLDLVWDPPDRPARLSAIRRRIAAHLQAT